MTYMTDQGDEIRRILSDPQVEDVFSATQEVRAARFAFVSEDLLDAVLAAERDNLDDRIAAQRAVAHVVDSWLERS
jgi:hypothetical protein